MQQSGTQGSILVIDDDEQIRRSLQSILRTKQYAVCCAGSGEEGLRQAKDAPPDLVILDLSLPGKSGLQVCGELRTWLQAPILVLSASERETDKIAALDLGADDYLTKPFPVGELLARLRALFRRASMAPTPQPVLTVGALTLELDRRRVLLAGEEIKLTPTEYDILAYLAHNANCVVTSRQLLAHLHGPDSSDDVQTLRVHISNLRKKIELEPDDSQYIQTEPGVGFRFVVE